MTNEQNSWDTMLQGMIEGDEKAFGEFWRRYGERLVRIAGRRLPQHLHRRVGPEDVVQSVCRTFFRRLNEGRFDFSTGQRLWPLLCAITLNKARMQVRFQLRDKRNLAREVGVDQHRNSNEEGPPHLEIPADDLGPQEAAAFVDQLEQIFAALDEKQRQVVQLRLEGYQSHEIAACLNCSTRQVRRIMSGMRDRLKEILLSDLSTGGFG